MYGVQILVGSPLALEDNTPVGACLSQYWQVWQQKGASPWVVSILLYVNIFSRVCHQTPMVWTASKDPVKQDLLQKYITEWLQNNAIEQVSKPNTPGFYRHIFLVPKKTVDLRLIIDLNTLQGASFNYIPLQSAGDSCESQQVGFDPQASFLTAQDFISTWYSSRYFQPRPKWTRLSLSSKTAQAATDGGLVHLARYALSAPLVAEKQALSLRVFLM